VFSHCLHELRVEVFAAHQKPEIDRGYEGFDYDAWGCLRWNLAAGDCPFDDFAGSSLWAFQKLRLASANAASRSPVAATARRVASTAGAVTTSTSFVA
jgi:hypothetical protein